MCKWSYIPSFKRILLLQQSNHSPGPVNTLSLQRSQVLLPLGWSGWLSWASRWTLLQNWNNRYYIPDPIKIQTYSQKKTWHYQISGYTGLCPIGHLFPHFNGYFCCSSPVTYQDRTQLLAYGDTMDFCSENDRILCPELPNGLCTDIDIKGFYRLSLINPISS